MDDQQHTIVLVLKNGKDFGFRDVELIVRHINGKWKSKDRPRIICFWDKASEQYDLGGVELIPLRNELPGAWSRMFLYSPKMEQYRPFLYVDLDTVIVNSLENIFELVKNPSLLITLEDFYQKRKLATGLVWVPAKSEKITKVWNAWGKTGLARKGRMDYFLWGINVTADAFWQNLTNTIYDFKPKKKEKLNEVPKNADLICFHGKPRIFQAAKEIDWVKNYIKTDFVEKKKVTVIIPYKVDRGWLQDAIDSVPDDVQLIVSQGEGNWPQNFNKVLDKAEGDYIKYLHEDDMLTENCIKDSVQAIEEQEVDFIHGDAIELYQKSGKKVIKRPKIEYPTLQDLMKNNVIHSPTIMYKREVFEKIGSFDESLTICEEYEFSLRCLHNGVKIGYCPSILAVYRRHSAQQIRKKSKSGHLVERNMVNNKYK